MNFVAGWWFQLFGRNLHGKKLPNHLVIPIEAANAAHDGQVIGDTLTR